MGVQASDTVLRVDNLSISYKVGRRWIRAVREFRVEVRRGQIVGVLGREEFDRYRIGRLMGGVETPGAAARG